VEAHAKSAGVPLERLGRFGSFYSRRAWLRFFREDANWQLWKSALGERSVSSLQPIFVYYRVG